MLQFGAFQPQNIQRTLGIKTYNDHLYNFTRIVTCLIFELFHNCVIIFLTPKGPNSQLGFLKFYTMSKKIVIFETFFEGVEMY